MPRWPAAAGPTRRPGVVWSVEEDMVTRRTLLSASALIAAAACTRAVRGAGAAAGAADGAFPLRRSEAEWRRALSPERFAVLRGGGTEPAFSSPLRAERRRGTYACAGCGQDSFSSAAKFDDGSGWPTFWVPFYGAVAEIEDRAANVAGAFDAFGAFRTLEPPFRAGARCSRCGGHLGTLSRDAPTPTGLRYRVDGLALSFEPAPSASS